HGDIRTETIIITWKDRPKLLHFGLSEFTSAGSAHRVSMSSPEPMQTAPCDGVLGDIRALGLVMYEMLTGRPPAAFRTPTWSSPAAATAEVPPEVDHVVRRALPKNPGEQYQTAVTVAAELRAVAAILDARTASASAALEARDENAPRYRRPLLAVLLLTTLASLVFSFLRLR